MSDAWRCFVAVPIGDDLRRDLAAAMGRWQTRPSLGSLRWSDPASWHLTLAFLGDVEPGTVSGIAGGLEVVATGHPAFTVTTGGLGGFPSASRARVAWYGVADGDRRLRRLADDVGRAVDLESDRPFTAHVTLGRSRAGPIDLRDWIRAGDAPSGALPIERLDLMRSHLGTGPARYETLASVPLGRSANAAPRSVRLGRNR